MIAEIEETSSEIVIPLIVRDRVVGVMDIDSPKLSRFNEEDGAGLERLASLWIEASETPSA